MYLYRKPDSTKDRVIIEVNGGVFNGSYAINVYSSNRGTNCPQVNINGGVFNGNVNIGHGKLIASGGTFNGWVNCTGDSTAYRQISGGTYKSWQFMTAYATNKFWVGTSSANYNVGVYVDDNGYLVVGGPAITAPGESFEASAGYSGWSSYLKYSSAATNNLYYTEVEEAFADNNKTTGVVTVHADELDLTNVTYKGTIVIPDTNEDITITVPENCNIKLSYNAENPPKLVDTAGNELIITATPDADGNVSGSISEIAAPSVPAGVPVTNNAGASEEFEAKVKDSLANAYASDNIQSVTIEDIDADSVTYDISGTGKNVEMVLPIMGDATTAYIVHTHDGVKYVYSGTVVNGV